jgi:hypothetical protein
MGNRFKEMAAELLQRYQQRKVRGELRVDDKLYLELTQVMPEKGHSESSASSATVGRIPIPRRKASCCKRS